MIIVSSNTTLRISKECIWKYLLLATSVILVGVRISYDMSKPEGSRVVECRLRCSQCRVPKYEALKKDTVYKVLQLVYYNDTGFHNYHIDLLWHQPVKRDAMYSSEENLD